MGVHNGETFRSAKIQEEASGGNDRVMVFWMKTDGYVMELTALNESLLGER
jgi:hypothetical protein